jgi:hypothetical protein
MKSGGVIKVKRGGARGKISGPEWAWELVGWLLVLAIVVTAARMLIAGG